MAEAIANKEAADVIEPSSAGLHPLGIIEESTADALRLNHYPVRGLASKPLKREALANADLIINMSGDKLDPAFAPQEKVEVWNISDPYGENAEFYQRILEELVTRVERLAKSLRQEQLKSSKAT